MYIYRFSLKQVRKHTGKSVVVCRSKRNRIDFRWKFIVPTFLYALVWWANTEFRPKMVGAHRRESKHFVCFDCREKLSGSYIRYTALNVQVFVLYVFVNYIYIAVSIRFVAFAPCSILILHTHTPSVALALFLSSFSSESISICKIYIRWACFYRTKSRGSRIICRTTESIDAAILDSFW